MGSSWRERGRRTVDGEGRARTKETMVRGASGPERSWVLLLVGWKRCKYLPVASYLQCKRERLEIRRKRNAPDVGGEHGIQGMGSVIILRPQEEGWKGARGQKYGGGLVARKPRESYENFSFP